MSAGDTYIVYNHDSDRLDFFISGAEVTGEEFAAHMINLTEREAKWRALAERALEGLELLAGWDDQVALADVEIVERARGVVSDLRRALEEK